MGKGASKATIGAFVLGAVALAVGAVLVFGSGRFFARYPRSYLNFEGSLKGLQVGSPVHFRGVKVGEVTDIRLRYFPDRKEFLNLVYIETHPEAIEVPTAAPGGRVIMIRPRVRAVDWERHNFLVDMGMKARLELQSFVTGILSISLDFYPDKPIRLTGADPGVPEIPTISARLEELQEQLRELPLKQIAQKIDNVATGLDRLVNAPETQKVATTLNRTLEDLDRLVNRMDGRIDPFFAEAERAIASAGAAFAQAEKTLALAEGVPGEVASNVNATLDEMRASLRASRETIERVGEASGQTAEVAYELSRAMAEVRAAARSLRALTDYLERHPESLIRGKNGPGGGSP